MDRLASGLWHWSAWHGNIGARVHSCYFEPAGLLIDPMLPREGLAWFRRLSRPPRLIALTNRLHYRHSGYFREEFGVPVFCHEAGLHEFELGEVQGFAHGDELAAGVVAIEIDSLCPEETALALPDGAIALGDAMVRSGSGLSFVPDAYMGRHPESVKAGLRLALERLARRPFRHLLLAHGAPFVGGGRAALRRFLGAARPAGPEAARAPRAGPARR